MKKKRSVFFSIGAVLECIQFLKLIYVLYSGSDWSDISDDLYSIFIKMVSILLLCLFFWGIGKLIRKASHTDDADDCYEYYKSEQENDRNK